MVFAVVVGTTRSVKAWSRYYTTHFGLDSLQKKKKREGQDEMGKGVTATRL